VIGRYVVPTPEKSCEKETYTLNNRISLGEEILLTQDKNPDKEAGVKAFLDGDCKTAINKFNLYHKAKPTDPEALIYLNNTKAREKGNRLKIAVSVPIGTQKGIAEEMLRGVAQAQNEVNNNKGINGKLLEIAIANDDNDSSEAVQIAKKFVKDTSILAVVGHNASNASISAAPEYQKNGLVMMSPTSYAKNIIIGEYIFRTAPGIEAITKSISDYAIKKMKKKNFLICVDQNPDNFSVKENFVEAIKNAGGRINPTNCNIAAPNFKPSEVISQAQNSGADALVLALYIDKSRRIKEGLALLQANQGQLTLFGTSALVTQESLEEGKDINGIITFVPWHSTAFPGNPFVQNANDLWKAPVSWRTATSYDATKAIIAGLQKSKTRYELQQTLSDPNFSVGGATGQIQFSSGNRKVGYDPTFPIKVQQKPGTDKYEFVPIP
jgi:branched-chain amino acid transport system substrate-binding protein